MDTTAFTLSQENELPIIVFDMNNQGNLKSALGENIGTRVFVNPLYERRIDIVAGAKENGTIYNLFRKSY